MRAHHRPRPAQRVDPAVDVEPFVELITEEAVERGLVGRHHRPHGDLVARALRAEPAAQVHHRAMELDVVARVDVVDDAEVIGELLLGRELVDVAHERIGADRQLRELAAMDDEAAARRIEDAPRRPLRFGGRARGRGRGLLLLLNGCRRHRRRRLLGVDHAGDQAERQDTQGGGCECRHRPPLFSTPGATPRTARRAARQVLACERIRAAAPGAPAAPSGLRYSGGPPSGGVRAPPLRPVHTREEAQHRGNSRRKRRSASGTAAALSKGRRSIPARPSRPAGNFACTGALNEAHEARIARPRRRGLRRYRASEFNGSAGGHRPPGVHDAHRGRRGSVGDGRLLHSGQRDRRARLVRASRGRGSACASARDSVGSAALAGPRSREEVERARDDHARRVLQGRARPIELAHDRADAHHLRLLSAAAPSCRPMSWPRPPDSRCTCSAA